jgi:peptidoglycan-associated lipoprotein
MRTILAWLGAVLALASLMNGCAKKAIKAPEAVSASGHAEADIRAGEFSAVDSLGAIRFPYDRDTLEEHARERLKRNAEVIKKHPRWQVLVEGHCDERGTAEYNLALGQRRARAVRDYYKLLGVPAGALATMSFGKEKPSCLEDTSACRQANRRAENKVRLGRAAAGSGT